MPPVITLLIRASGRPNLFRRALNSIVNQTNKNWRIVVGIDTPTDMDWLQQYMPFISKVVQYQTLGVQDGLYYYNRYCNLLLDEVQRGGWGLFLDDDDYLHDETVLEQLAPFLTEPAKAVVCQMLRRNKPKPTCAQIQNEILLSGWCGLPCVAVPYALRNAYRFSGQHENEDYRFIKHLVELHGAKWVKVVVVETDRRSYGTRIDMLK